MIDSKKKLALVATLFAIATTPLNVVPLTIGALITVFAVAEDSAGALLTVELLVMAGVAFLLAPMRTRALSNKLVIFACLLSPIAALWAAEIDLFSSLYWARVPAGFAAGLLLLVVNVAIAQSTDPVRVYGIAAFVTALVSICMLLGMPVAIERFAMRGAYWPLAGLAIVTAPIWLRLSIESISSQHARDASETAVRLSPIVVATFIVGNFIIQSVQSSYFAFVERRGSDLQIDAATIGLILALAYTTNLIATALASWFGERFGYIRPLLAGLAVHAICIWIALSTDSVTVFTAAVFGQTMSYFFSIPFQLGIGAALDKSGRLAAVGAATFFLGLAVGPLFGGLVIAKTSFAMLGNVVVAGTTVGLILYAISLRRHYGSRW